MVVTWYYWQVIKVRRRIANIQLYYKGENQVGQVHRYETVAGRESSSGDGENAEGNTLAFRVSATDEKLHWYEKFSKYIKLKK